MGIESDQLVFDYLSRVGDLAQQQQLNSGDRMRLVSTLRGEIDRQRAKAIGGPDSAAAVQRILGRLGTPDEIVEAAGGTGVEATLSSRTSRRVLPRQRKGSGAARGPKDEDPTGPTGRTGPAHPSSPVDFGKESGPSVPYPTGPHLAGTDELGTGTDEWWRTEPGPFGGLGTSVPGFTGGVEIPEILKPPPEEDEEEAESAEGDEDAEEAPARRLIPRRLRRRTAAPVEEAVEDDLPVRGPVIPRGSPFLLLAALLLVTGAVLGNLPALAGGWFLAYFSRRLTRTQAKWAVLGLPGLVAVGGAVWLWGRTEDRWGAPLSTQGDALGTAMTGLWPVLLRTAAVATTLYLIWRAKRLSR
ncbi:hypothetical protein [Streptomyces sp. NPDC051561]|uniref:hypothetical protein n=1 Tax=Streptomyces sp. NPDC051561 TaxID=3365658 RepID=UPI0037B08D17